MLPTGAARLGQWERLRVQVLSSANGENWPIVEKTPMGIRSNRVLVTQISYHNPILLKLNLRVGSFVLQVPDLGFQATAAFR